MSTDLVMQRNTAGKGCPFTALLVGAVGRTVASLGLCVLLSGLLAPGLMAKQKPMPTKSISGAVLDLANNDIAGASVFLTDIDTHHRDAIYSGADGTYNFSGLDPSHDYQVQAKYKNRASEVRSVSSYDTRSAVVVNLVLKPAASKSTSGSH